MYPTTFAVITVTGNVLYHDIIRYEADKALHAANEPVQLWRKRVGLPPEAIDNNFDVFPLEPEGKSAWIPVGERLPKEGEDSGDFLVTDGQFRLVGYLFRPGIRPGIKLAPPFWRNTVTHEKMPYVTHWQELPALP